LTGSWHFASCAYSAGLLEEVDSYIREQGFANRSEIIRQALRAHMSEGKKLEEIKGATTATLTIVNQKGARTGPDNNYSTRLQ